MNICRPLFLGVLLLIGTVIFTSWIAFNGNQDSNSNFKKKIYGVILLSSKVPHIIKYSFKEIFSADGFLDFSSNMLRTDSFDNERFPCEEDKGYLLISGIDPSKKRANIRLLRLSDGMVVQSWSPDLRRLYSSQDTMFSIKDLQIMNPFLMSNGEIIAHANGHIFKININSKIEWVVYGKAHHSLDVDIEGNIWALTKDNNYLKEQLLNDDFDDDALLHLDLNGNLVENISFSKILIDNGLIGFLFAQHGMKLQNDIVHLNSISIARTNSKYWKKADLLISSRHLNTIFLYRPSTKKIIWYKTGPWLNQHSANFVNDHEISIYGNNVVVIEGNKSFFINGTNKAYIFDFKKNSSTVIYPDLFSKLGIQSVTQGSLKILKDGSIFIEDTEKNRHIRGYENGGFCMRYNKYDAKRSGAVSWGSYFDYNPLPKHNHSD